MNFLALVIALSLQQVIKTGSPLQRDEWLLQFEDFLEGLLPAAGLRIVLLLLALSLAASWILDVLGTWLFGLPELLAAAAMLLWSLGRDDYHTVLERFEARYASDREGACATVGDLWAPIAEDQEHTGNLSERAIEHLAYSGYERWFAPVFYFVLLGPVGAFVYRVVGVLARSGSDSHRGLLHWLDWLPARVLSLSFALTGDFVAVVQHHPPAWFRENRPIPALLRETAACACNGAEGARAVASIMYRSAGLWLLVISLGFVLL